MNSKKGFTLLEVLVVTVIAASLLLFAVPAYKRAQDKSNYTAALGVLTELRGGVLGLRQDLKMAGSSKKFPLDSVGVQIGPSYFDPSLPSYSETLAQSVEDVDESNYAYALFSHNYMQPIQLDELGAYKNYHFYVCGESSNTQCCLANTKTVACMLDWDSCSRPSKGVYYGARINEQGEVTVLENNSCQ